MSDSAHTPGDDADVMTLSATRVGSVAVITVTGELDLLTARELMTTVDETLEWPDLTGVVVDLTAVSFLDSAGLAVLVDAHEHATLRGIALKVVVDGAGSAVARAFQTAAIHEHLDLRHSLGDALFDDGRPAP